MTRVTDSKPTRSRRKGTIEQLTYPVMVQLEGACAQAITAAEVAEPADLEQAIGAFCRLSSDAPMYRIGREVLADFDPTLPADLLQALWGWHGSDLVRLSDEGLALEGACAVLSPFASLEAAIAQARELEAKAPSSRPAKRRHLDRPDAEAERARNERRERVRRERRPAQPAQAPARPVTPVPTPAAPAAVTYVQLSMF